MSKQAEDTDDPTSDVSCSQMHSVPGDGGHDTKRMYDELVKEVEQLRAADIKRKKRKHKPSEKGSSFKRLCNIPDTAKLPEQSTFIIGKMTRKILWRNMKYFNDMYKTDCLKLALPRLGLRTDQDKDKYSDCVLFYIDQKLNACRNNTIHALKKLVSEDKTGDLKIPEGYSTWHDAILDFVRNRGDTGTTPDTANPRVWRTYEIMSCVLMPRVCNNYKTMDEWATNDYHRTVTPSDEAFVWQVMTYYYPHWVEANSSLQDETSVSESVRSGSKSGPSTGFKDTASKTIVQYHDYVRQMGISREGVNARLWSERLQEAAKKTWAQRQAVKQAEEGEAVGELSTDFLQYTKFNLCDIEELDDEVAGWLVDAVGDYTPRVSMT